MTNRQFMQFVVETGRDMGTTCLMRNVKSDNVNANAALGHVTFRNPPFPTSPDHPVVCVTFSDAEAYAQWLSKRTNRRYRLPSEAEWEYAARAGTMTSYSFGSRASDLCKYARFADLDTTFSYRSTCRSGIGAPGPLPVGSLAPNPWGIHDMHGNVWEFVQDCWARSTASPANDAALSDPACRERLMRGGGWSSDLGGLRSSRRSFPVPHDRRSDIAGFRVAVSLGDAGPAGR